MCVQIKGLGTPYKGGGEGLTKGVTPYTSACAVLTAFPGHTPGKPVTNLRMLGYINEIPEDINYITTNVACDYRHLTNK